MANARCFICTERKVGVIDIIHVSYGDRYQVCFKIYMDLEDYLIVLQMDNFDLKSEIIFYYMIFVVSFNYVVAIQMQIQLMYYKMYI